MKALRAIQGSRFKVQTAFMLIVCFLTGLCFAKEGDLWQTTGNVTVREAPNANSGVVSYLKQGAVVEELAQQGNWIKIKSTRSGIEGWVHRSLLAPRSKEIQKACEGVQGFSAVCPANRDAKIPQGQEVEQAPKTAALQPLQGVPQAGQPQVNQGPAVLPGAVAISSGQGPVAEKETHAAAGTPGESKLKVQVLNILGSGESFSYETEGELPAHAYIVEPERTTMVRMSSSDVNRIVCPVDIKDVVYSEEKGIQVKISGKNAFVKFLIKRIAGKETYSRIPADIYVVCGDKVYNIIAVPERIPSVNVYLEDKGQKVKEVLEKNQAMPYEKKIVNYVKDFMSGKVPPEAVFSRVNKEYRLFQDVEIREEGHYVIEGEGLTVRLFRVTGKKQGGVEIKEKDFLKKEITQNPLAISLDRLKLNQGEKAILLIIEKTRG